MYVSPSITPTRTNTSALSLLSLSLSLSLPMDTRALSLSLLCAFSRVPPVLIYCVFPVVGVLRCLTGAMRGVIKKDITEHHILQRYASVRIAVDELVNQGTLEQVDSTYITRMNKMEIKE
eukprot:TRINITY_DN2311_c0_g1_i13.p2 TRINITY_DN2311_c0_g1~~TRINITY_DN2311_c0_g1_i13.p2  ORF type:complete len:120 (-),score=19.57 TRINITY_DN2311_c0_g1_i13:33-392(-)